MKIGDTVVFTNNRYDGKFLKNMKGKIIEKTTNTSVCVEFFKNIGGHKGNGLGMPGHCWVVPVKSLKLCSIKFR